MITKQSKQLALSPIRVVWPRRTKHSRQIYARPLEISRGYEKQPLQALKMGASVEQQLIERRFRELIGSLYHRYMGPSDFEREIVVTPTYGNHSVLSSIIIEINGSPPKGTVICLVAHPQQVTFVADGKSKTFTATGLSKEFKIIQDFIETLDIPHINPKLR